MDVITYCNNTEAFVEELKVRYPDWLNIEDPENPCFLVPKAPNLIRNGNETLALCRLQQINIDAINTLETIQILGTYEQIFADPAKKEIYDRVYDQTPREIEMDDGATVTYTPPQRFVVIA